MKSPKTRPIGHGVRNVPVTLSNEEVLGLERVSKVSGVSRSPYVRALIQWAVEHEIVMRPKVDEYQAYLDAIQKGVSPLPKYRLEPAVTVTTDAPASQQATPNQKRRSA